MAKIASSKCNWCIDGVETCKTVFRASLHSQSKSHLLYPASDTLLLLCVRFNDLVSFVSDSNGRYGQNGDRDRAEEDDWRGCKAVKTTVSVLQQLLILNKMVSWSWGKLPGEVKGQESDFHSRWTAFNTKLPHAHSLWTSPNKSAS